MEHVPKPLACHAAGRQGRPGGCELQPSGALLHAEPLALVCFVWRAQWWVQCSYICGGRGGFRSGLCVEACRTLQDVVHPGQLVCATASTLCASHVQAVPSLLVKRQPHAPPGEVCCFGSCVNDSAASCYSTMPVSSALRQLLPPWVAALLVVHCSLCGCVCVCVLAATCGRSVLPSLRVTCLRQTLVLCANSLQHIARLIYSRLILSSAARLSWPHGRSRQSTHQCVRSYL